MRRSDDEIRENFSNAAGDIFISVRHYLNKGVPTMADKTVEDDLGKATHFNFKNYIRPHGVGLRGLEVPRGSEQFEGRFGRMFRTLTPAEHRKEDLEKLAGAMTAELEDPPTPETEDDDEENPKISAGYTYFGQFIDHDLTFDPASSLQKTNDPDALVDFRTPRFDLDSVYGRGPDDQPYLYDDDGIHMLLGARLTGNPDDDGTHDLIRNAPKQRALIGDPRNDENTIVSQLQGTFLRFHNKMVAVESKRRGRPATFAEVQRAVRRHYQWAVLHDFLPTIAGWDVVYAVLPHLKSKKPITVDKPKLDFFHWRNAPFMPIEFSVAAYRFGHSMIRPIYRLNRGNDRFPIFADADPNLRGFRAVPPNFAIEWKLFFPIDPKAPKLDPKRIQPAYKIDSSLVNPLGKLPPSVAKNPASLAARNLIRGLRMQLPSGQRVARQMGFTPLEEDELKVGKAADNKTNPTLVSKSEHFRNNAPLWFYILSEAQHQHGGTQLGQVGGRIVTEVFVGLLLGDSHSFISQNPNWVPYPEICRDGKTFDIADLIVAATKKP
jgi:hypothetical protein